VGIAGNNVGFAVSVQASDGQESRRGIDWPDRVTRAARKSAEPIAEQNCDGAAGGVGSHQIKLAVAIEVSPRDRPRRLADAESNLRLESNVRNTVDIEALWDGSRRVVVAVASL